METPFPLACSSINSQSDILAETQKLEASPKSSPQSKQLGVITDKMITSTPRSHSKLPTSCSVSPVTDSTDKGNWGPETLTMSPPKLARAPEKLASTPSFHKNMKSTSLSNSVNRGTISKKPLSLTDSMSPPPNTVAPVSDAASQAAVRTKLDQIKMLKESYLKEHSDQASGPIATNKRKLETSFSGPSPKKLKPDN